MPPEYESALRASERIAWKLDDVLSRDAAFDFERPFLPESLASASELAFLAPREQRTLNQIRAHGYLATFGLVEEFILPFVLERLRERGGADMDEVRALLAFAGEEAKHIELFRRFCAVFERGFGEPCAVIGPPSAIAEHVLSHSELGVGLLILHIEWMTQQHYVEMVKGDPDIEPRFRALLHQHWLEECQHAQIDGWIVDAAALAATPEERARGFDEYVALLEFFDAGLAQQAELDLASLSAVTARTFDGAERARFLEIQRQSQRRTYLGAGVRHPRLRAAVARVHPAGLETLDSLARTYA